MKKYLKIIGFGVAAGLILLFVQKSLNIDEAVFMKYYWIVGIIIVSAAVLFNVLYNLYYVTKMHRLLPLLSEENIDDYLSGMNRIYKKVRGDSLKSLLKLNLAAGYLEKKDYNTALELLESLSEKKFKDDVLFVHRLDLCLAHFYTGQPGKALSVYNENKELFDKYRDHELYKASVAAVDALAAAADDPENIKEILAVGISSKPDFCRDEESAEAETE